MILISWLAYHRQNRSPRQKVRFRLPGGKVMVWSSLTFFALMLIALALKDDTRAGLLAAPLWFLWLAIVWKSKKNKMPSSSPKTAWSTSAVQHNDRVRND